MILIKIVLLLLFFPAWVWAQTPPTGFFSLSGTGWTQGSGVATAPVSFGYDRWNTAFGPDQQAACTISALPNVGETLHILFRAETMQDRIRLILHRNTGSNNDTLELGEVVSGVTNTFATVNLGVDAQVGDKIGINIASNLISGNYWSVDAGWSAICTTGGSDWCTVVTGTATRTPASSYIGLGGQSPAACTQFFGQGDAVGGDTTPPAPDPPQWTAAPATATSQTEINLAANVCTDAVGVVSYNFESCTPAACSTWGTPAIPSSASPILTVSELTANTLYRFRFRCFDGINFSTTYSSIQEATTFTNADTTAPTAPTNLMVSRVPGRSLILNDAILSWTASTDTGGSGINFYRVEQGNSACNNFTEIGQTNTTASTFIDSDVALNAALCYRVRAEDVAGNNSSYSSNVVLYPVSGGRFR